MKSAVITGITGQDGSYLAELLLGKGYQVHGIVRRSSIVHRERIDHLRRGRSDNSRALHLHYGDLGDTPCLIRLMGDIQPNEVYNLAAQSHVGISFTIPEFTVDITGTGTVRILEAIRQAGLAQKTRFYQASSSEMFGAASEVPQTERTAFHPRSPYACAKAMSYWLTINYREAYGLHASNGILFNHESPRRGENFVTRKITRAVARIKLGRQRQLALGNLETQRDWGYAPEYVEAMWRMLQHHEPGDYVVATGETHTVREFVEAAFGHVGLDWKAWVVHDPHYDRPADVAVLLGDASKAKEVLGWEPRVRMKELAALMVDADLRAAQEEAPHSAGDPGSVE